MGGPVQIPFKSFIQLKPNDATALYLQIVFEFIKAIQMGLLPEGTKLPGTRQLCKVLGINRNTLIKAFEDLESQGWIEILPNKGTFILSKPNKANRAEKPLLPQQKAEGSATGFSFTTSTLLENPTEVSNLPYAFNDGQPDVRLLPTVAIGRLYASQLKKFKPANSQEAAHQNLKTQLSNYLNLTRGLRIATSNLLTTHNHETALYLIIKLLISKGDRVMVAAPGYYASNMVLADAGAQIIPVSIDKEGISTKHIKSICKEQPVRMLYLTSNYHYPTTTPLSARRRMELLQLADEYGFIILEDDYDFDFNYDNNPTLPLAALDYNGKVVYCGSFGKLLPAGFGVGFVTGTTAFITELAKHKSLVASGTDIIKELTLTEWITEGDVHRLSKKNKKHYKERRDYFVSLLDKHLKGKIKYSIPTQGLAIWIEWQDSFNLIALQKECAAKGLFLSKTILYQTKTLTATRMGFGHFSVDEMERVVMMLKDALGGVVVS
ncbi:PLP-dependent aminotransferase family protein [Flavobacterium sp. RHBU_3]|uniref:aminotransferase-like domain-containing protein n=1 Tax=Flavobacterium sp. RHBU_3 TaxID=3391184 RepID=UPI0039847A04